MQVTWRYGDIVRWPMYPGYSPNGPSGSIESVGMIPSMIISPVAGTSRSMVLHGTTGTGSLARPPASRYSSKSYGIFAVAEYAIFGVTPMAIAAWSGTPLALHLRQ